MFVDCLPRKPELRDYKSPEKDIIKEKFNTIPYMDIWICSIIEGYIYGIEDEEEYGGDYYIVHLYDIRYGVREGKYSVYTFNDYTDVNVLIGTGYCKNGKREGEYKELWKNLGIEEPSVLKIHCYYKEGELEGEYKKWYPDGKMWVQCYYKEGIEEGEYTVWYENGKIDYKYYMKNGKKEGEGKEWYENGQLCVQRYYKDGKREGECKEWHENGQQEVHCYYKQGELEGECKLWYDNGKLDSITNYKDGHEEGEYKWLDEEGNLIEHKIYKDGVVIKDLLVVSEAQLLKKSN